MGSSSGRASDKGTEAERACAWMGRLFSVVAIDTCQVTVLHLYGCVSYHETSHKK